MKSFKYLLRVVMYSEYGLDDDDDLFFVISSEKTTLSLL